ncbi:hypothetical protein F0L74_30560 [Chitinophaga agrisoli]|uniref:Outer membrane protein with beta-barrel domain n=1 Tax=Chitinophaga agrisoli TaxID=2607653 RepID=A0A5B2VP62_9BACT|nr:hypothetical protein [Chitinophaga agrisoli]KAA2240498.1 hypothetical protein F0L74_30560 [Chitinophaga agrisoli]
MKRLLLCVLLLGGIQLAHAQYYKTDTTSRKGLDPSRLMIGGSVGLIFGDYTNINVSPLLGYRFSDMFAAGVSINAQYASEKYEDFSGRTYQKDQYTVLGGGLWGRFYPLDMIFVHAQPELNYVAVKSTFYEDPKTSLKESHAVPSLLLGGGYSQPLGENGGSAFYIMILYDVIQDQWSPYQNRPLFRVGFNVGL